MSLMSQLYRKSVFHLNLPSNPTQPLDLQSTGMEHINTEESGRSNGRNDSVWAHIGVSKIAGTEGWTMDPPAANEYAVDPDNRRRSEQRKKKVKKKKKKRTKEKIKYE